MIQDSLKDMPSYIPARVLNEYTYCPRIAYIEWRQGEFKENRHTLDGTFKHRNVDREKGALPSSHSEEFPDNVKVHSLWLSAPTTSISSRIDLIEVEKNEVIPVDYKRGHMPDIPEKSWDADRIQVCAQGLILQENGYSCSRGYIYYIASKRRAEVLFTNSLIEQTKQTIADIYDTFSRGKIPPPLENSKKCEGCSLAGICLPDEIHYLNTERKIKSSDNSVIRRLLVPRLEAMPLYVQEQGAYIKKKGGLLVIYKKGEKISEVKAIDISQVTILGNVQFTTQAMRFCLERGIPISYHTYGGRLIGLMVNTHHKNVELRMKQFQYAINPEFQLSLARSFVHGKIENSRTFLKRNAPGISRNITTQLQKNARDALKAPSIDTLLGIEGMAAKTYFASFSGMFKSQDEHPAFDFEKRNRRPPADPVNAMLSFCYTLLVKDMLMACSAAGFDPFLGFFHQPHYGRPALALDLMEELRPIIADSTVIWVINNRYLTPEDFIIRGKNCSMTRQGRKKLILAYEKRMDALVSHPLFGYKISYRRILSVQARLLGRYLYGEINHYPSFRTR